MQIWQKVILGLIFGIIFGIYAFDYVSYVKPIGDIFLRLIKMILSPLIFFCLVSSITSMNNANTLNRLGIKAIIAFFLTTIFATTFGITVGLILEPGKGVKINFDLPYHEPKKPSFDMIEFLINLVPNNIIGSFVEGNVIQIVFGAIITGITINAMGKNTAQIKGLFHGLSKMILKMISIVTQLSPYTVFALTAWVVGTQGIDIIISLSNLVIAVVVAMIAQYLIFGLLIRIFCRISPIPFYKKSFEYQILAFSTSSSKATLPTTMRVCNERMTNESLRQNSLALN